MLLIVITTTSVDIEFFVPGYYPILLLTTYLFTETFSNHHGFYKIYWQNFVPRGSTSGHGQGPDNPWFGVSFCTHRSLTRNGGFETDDSLVVVVILEYLRTWDNTSLDPTPRNVFRLIPDYSVPWQSRVLVSERRGRVKYLFNRTCFDQGLQFFHPLVTKFPTQK